MLGKIDEIIDNSVIIKLDIDISEQPNLVNLHVVFEDEGKTKVVAEVVKHGKAKKVVVYKYNAKKNYHKKQGHRQPYTKVEIKTIK